MTPMKDVKVLVVDDNALILDLLMKGLMPHCDARAAADGADALLKIVDDPPDLVVCDYRMPGLDGRQLYEKMRGRQQTQAIPFIFLASRSDIEEKLRPIVEGVEEFIPKPFFLKDLVRSAKKVVDRLQLEKLQKRAGASRRDSGPPGRNVDPGFDAVAGNGPEELPVDDSPRRRYRRIVLRVGSMQGRAHGRRRRRKRRLQAVKWPDGEFEIDFNKTASRETITRTTTGLLMEGLRLIDEGQRDGQSEDAIVSDS